MTREHLQDLITRYANGTASPEEITELHSWYRAMDMEEVHWPAEDEYGKEQVRQQMLRRLQQEIKQEKRSGRIYRLNRLRWAAAAVVLLLAGTAIWMIRPVSAPLPLTAAKDTVFPNDAMPGGNKATLTLADGSTIMLDSAANGIIAQQAGASVQQPQEGKLVYQPGTVSSGISYNTLATPRGGQYQVLLPDGTRVWLNAASSLTYPTAFTGPERKVELTGEGYFEVAKHAAKPFKVKTNEVEVEVLGTHFNIMAYADEPTISATLLEGSIRLAAGKETILMEPGQQAQLNSATQKIRLATVNVEEAVAWKHGYFLFNKQDMAGILRQVARWYDISVQLPAEMPKDAFSGKISRDVKLSKLLSVLETSGLHFNIEGNKLIVNR